MFTSQLSVPERVRPMLLGPSRARCSTLDQPAGGEKGRRRRGPVCPASAFEPVAVAGWGRNPREPGSATGHGADVEDRACGGDAVTHGTCGSPRGNGEEGVGHAEGEGPRPFASL